MGRTPEASGSNLAPLQRSRETLGADDARDGRTKHGAWNRDRSLQQVDIASRKHKPRCFKLWWASRLKRSGLSNSICTFQSLPIAVPRWTPQWQLCALRAFRLPCTKTQGAPKRPADHLGAADCIEVHFMVASRPLAPRRPSAATNAQRSGASLRSCACRQLSDL